MAFGVNSGFGRHMTEQLLGRGDRVAGTVRKMDAVSDLKENAGKPSDSARLSEYSSGATAKLSEEIMQGTPIFTYAGPLGMATSTHLGMKHGGVCNMPSRG